MKKWLISLSAFLIFPGVASAADSLHARSNEEALMKFTQLLKPTPENDLFMQPILTEKLSPGTHLRIFYSSQNSVPIEYGPYDLLPADLLHAVLPPAENGEEVVSLMESPSWRDGEGGILLRVYGKDGEDPVIQKLRREDQLNSGEKFSASLKHPFYPERFTYSSMSELAGYRFQRHSMTLLLGVFMIIIFVVVSARSKAVLKHAGIICLCFLFIYEARFLFDIVPHRARTWVEWWGRHRLSHMGDAYAIASGVNTAGEGSVYVCNPQIATAMTYLLFPREVSAAGDPSSYAFVITDRVWENDLSTFKCGDHEFAGSVLQLFPDGEAIVRTSS